MGHISEHLPEIQKQQEAMPSTINSKKILSQMEEPDRAVIEYKYKSKRFGEMTSTDQRRYAHSLLLKITVITGWVIDQILMNILTEQFEKKLIESYSDMNPDEIEFAFRRDGTVIKDWGKPMNLSLIDEVLIPYRNTRLRLSLEMEERSKEPPPVKIYNEEENRQWMRQETEAAYQRILRGNLNFIPRQTMIDILKFDGLMKDDNLDQFLLTWINSGNKNIYIKT